MPATYSVDQSDKRHKGQHLPVKVEKSAPPVKKDSKAAGAKSISNPASEKVRMDYSAS
jgi:hypothetical protein|tara:strand:- start:1514 stop:1687 length:174 start_codon:yes stop_codon:yes gene_type:complete